MSEQNLKTLLRCATRMPEVRLDEARRFMEDALMAVDVPEAEAKAHADLLLHADSVGHSSHGMNRLAAYINDCKTGACNPKAKPTILKETAATAWVDAAFSLGATTGNFCMDLAIKKAKESGVGWISAKNCNHNGMASYWANKAERHGFIGMAFTNSPPVMVPTRAKQRALGTNPISMVAPAANCDRMAVDLATSTVAMGKIEVNAKKDLPIPLGWALGFDGKPTTNAKEAAKAGLLMPLGGDEKNSGFKGYALAAMVEIFCSGLSGSNPSHKIHSWDVDNNLGSLNLGQCFAVINPECFAPGFKDRVSECIEHWRSLEPAEPGKPVLAPGDAERMRTRMTIDRGTVAYPQKQIDLLKALAEKYRIKPLQTELMG